MAKANPRRRARSRPPKTTPKPVPDFSILLYRLAEGIAFVATATRAMEAVEDETGSATALAIADEILALRHGVSMLRAAFTAFDNALAQVAS